MNQPPKKIQFKLTCPRSKRVERCHLLLDRPETFPPAKD